MWISWGMSSLWSSSIVHKMDVIVPSPILNPISGATEKLYGLRSGDLNSNVPFFEGLDGVIGSPLMIMSNLMNQTANLGGQEILHRYWNQEIWHQTTDYSQHSHIGVAYPINMLLDNPSAPTWFLNFVVLYNHWCLAKDESHVKLSGRVPQMVGTGQIKLGKLIMRPDGDFTWHNCSLDSLLYSTFLCNFTHTDSSSISLRGSSLIFWRVFVWCHRIMMIIMIINVLRISQFLCSCSYWKEFPFATSSHLWSFGYTWSRYSLHAPIVLNILSSWW